MRRWALVVMLASVPAACSKAAPAAPTTKTVTIPIPNTPAPEKEGFVELTKYAEKVVVTNHTNQPAADCVVIVDDAIRGDLGALEPRATVTVMRSRFRPYTEADAFYTRAKKAARMECQTPSGPVVIRFQDGPEYTAPAAALIPPK